MRIPLQELVPRESLTSDEDRAYRVLRYGDARCLRTIMNERYPEHLEICADFGLSSQAIASVLHSVCEDCFDNLCPLLEPGNMPQNARQIQFYKHPKEFVRQFPSLVSGVVYKQAATLALHLLLGRTKGIIWSSRIGLGISEADAEEILLEVHDTLLPEVESKKIPLALLADREAAVKIAAFRFRQKANNWVRGNNRRRVRERVAILAYPAELPTDFAEQLINRELLARAKKALRVMDSMDRGIVLLRNVAELEWQEIADQSGMSISTVRRRHRLAMEELKKKLA